MLRFRIRIKYGSENSEKVFFFVHKDYLTLSEEKQRELFDLAVKELNHVYKDYGRLATINGVASLFDKFGFQPSLP